MEELKEAQKYAVLSGNELIVQGALEAGFHLYTGYPGSPLADYFNILNERKEELKAKGIKVIIANSEANAAAMASGAKLANKNTIMAMKCMGLNVASDALSVGQFGTPGPLQAPFPGVVVVVGDDPWSMSTSAPMDSRYLFRHLHIPFLTPSTPQELKDWMKVALELSQETSLYVGVLLTTAMAEGGGRVTVSPEVAVNGAPIELNPQNFNLQKQVMAPPHSLLADREMIEERFPRFKVALQKKKLGLHLGNHQAKRGIISSGMEAEMVLQVLQQNNLLGEEWQFFKVATPYPLVEEELRPFLRQLETLVVVEEKRGFLEDEVRSLVQREGKRVEVLGKELFPAFGGLTFEMLQDQILGEKSILNQKAAFSVPARLPTFCPGCPHRETLSLMKEMREILAKQGVKLISHGDVGCYSLSFLPPFREMHDLSAMGQGGAMGAGTDIFIKNPSVVLMGDSTFFHSGMSSISNSLQLGHNITYILLDNDNTAMTGHQVTPASGVTVEGEARSRQEMLHIVRGMGIRSEDAIEVNPSDRYFYKNVLLETVQRPGVKVIVSNKECALTYHGRLKRQERSILKRGESIEVKSFYQINTAACEDCRVCVEMTGCPGLAQTEDAYGAKMVIDAQICVADSYCTKLKACPSFEKVEVFDYRPKSPNLNALMENLTSPSSRINFAQIAAGRAYRIVVIGVGGSGVTTISKVLSKLAVHMGKMQGVDFKFFDQKGLAQRNGSVISHLVFFPKDMAYTTTTPVGGGDLILSPDLLEGTRAAHFLRTDGEGVAVVDKDFQVPTSMILNRYEGEKAPKAEDFINQWHEDKTRTAHFQSFKQESYRLFGRSVYAASMILGFAFQKGLLPGRLEDLRLALEESLPESEFNPNWQAFLRGRELVQMEGENVLQNEVAAKNPALWEESLSAAYFWRGERELIIAEWKKTWVKLQNLFPVLNEEHSKQWAHDIALFGGVKNLQNFMQDVSYLQTQFLHEHSQSVDWWCVLRILAKTYFIKDEVFVSHQMISPMKKMQDEKTYAHLGKSFRVEHINRPAFDIGSRKLEFDLSPKFWMLKIMRHMRWLRVVLPTWHQKERQLQQQIRRYLFLLPEIKQERTRILHYLDNVKGYREVRYKAAEENFKRIDDLLQNHKWEERGEGKKEKYF